MSKIIFLSFIISFLLIYIIKLLLTIDFLGSDETKTSTDIPIFLTSDIVSQTGIPSIQRNIRLLRPANVPLLPLVAPLKILDPITTEIPTFLVYKTDYLTKVKDQGICGSCWVFSVIAMLGDRLSINTKGEDIRNLSAQQLLSCFQPDDGCLGNSPEDLLFWLEESQYKIKTSKDISYRQERSDNITTTCPLSNSGLTVVQNSVHSLTEFLDEDDPDPDILEKNIVRMKTELIENGPFFCALTTYEDFYEYDGLTVYSHSLDSPLVGGHAIEVIGYCDKGVDNRSDINGQAYWICRNSWGSDWPSETDESGYFAIKMGTNECGIESRSGSADPFVAHKNKSDIRIMRYNTFDSFIRYNRAGMFS